MEDGQMMAMLTTDADLTTISDFTDKIIGIKVFPVPAKNSLTIENAENADLLMYNTLGQQIISCKNISDNYTLDISGLNKGIYMLKLSKNDKFDIRTIIIE